MKSSCDVFILWKIAEAFLNCRWTNHRAKRCCGDGVPSTFLAVMQCSLIFLAVNLPPPPMSPSGCVGKQRHDVEITAPTSCPEKKCKNRYKWRGEGGGGDERKRGRELMTLSGFYHAPRCIFLLTQLHLRSWILFPYVHRPCTRSQSLFSRRCGPPNFPTTECKAMYGNRRFMGTFVSTNPKYWNSTWGSLG